MKQSNNRTIEQSNNENLEKIRHSLSHIMAQAVGDIFKDVKFGIGPTIEDGFYYDFELPRPLTDKDLPEIEKRMKQLLTQKIEFKKSEVKPNEARIRSVRQPYKLELIGELAKEKEPISYYTSGSFDDLCGGPHVNNTKEIPKDSFKLTRIAGAYWRGKEKNPQLQRIYGMAFETKRELENRLKMLEEAKNRDHRKLGQELELFMIDEEVGAGLILWLPKGAILRREMENFVLEEYQRRGYQLVITPHIASQKLFSKSGHLDFYKDGMYSPMDIDGENYYVKPMNCPFHIKIYQQASHSYRELPIRYTELGTVYRYEKSGVLHGLLRVRGLTQDDAHIICTEEQLTDELVGVIDLTKYILETFGFKKFKVILSVRGKDNKKNYLGSDQEWKLAEEGLIKALKAGKWDYQVEEGEAVFYGPKIDIKVLDVMGREWQISTIQLDFNLPKRFNMNYIHKNGNKKKPFMLHRALLGSLERFTGVLIEHYGGAFPTWLSPIQIYIIPVGKAHFKFCEELGGKLKAENIRAEVDLNRETVGYKIRKSEKMKVPYMLVIGDKEMKSKSLNVRIRGQKAVNPVRKSGALDPTSLSKKRGKLYSSQPPQEAGLSNGVKKMTQKAFVDRIKKEIDNRR